MTSEREAAIRFALFGCVFEIARDMPGLWEAVSVRLPPVVFSRSSTAPVRRYALRATNGGVLVARARRRPILARDVAAAADALVDDIERTISRNAAGRIFVHAGAVSWNGRAILLPGRSGAGKSELVAALVRRGAEYLSDEFAVLDEQGRAQPYARPLALRRGAKTERPVPASLGARVAAKPVPVGRIAFLKFRENAKWSPRSCSAGEALLGLLQHTLSARERIDDARLILRRVASSAAATTGLRAEAAETAALLLADS